MLDRSERPKEPLTTYLDRQVCCAADGEVLHLVTFDHYVLDWHVVCMRDTYVYLDPLLALVLKATKASR
jgi:hypothetical protein